MAPDLLSTICREIDERLNELRPLLAEQERLLGAADALVAADREDPVPRAEELQPAKKPRRSAARPKADAARPKADAGLKADVKPKAERAARGAAREAILGALEHGSHTVGELAVVTAMSGPNINGNLRRLAAEGVVVKAEREGKAAWALAEPTV